MTPLFHIGDPWYVNVVVELERQIDKGRKPTEVKGVYYTPAEWELKERNGSPTGHEVTFSELSSTETTSTWETLVIEELNEAGIWRIDVISSVPIKGVEPALITVQALGEL